MARGDQLGRQWKILQMLIDAKTGRSVADIADRLACHTRTVYRDLIALQTAGFPIYDEKQGGKSLWFMLESRKSISMPLSMTELTALYFGRDFLNILKNSVFHDSQEIQDQPDGSIIFSAETAGIHDMRIWILSWGSKAGVLAPESLKEMITSEIEALNRLYE